MGRSPRMLAGFVQSSLEAIDAIDRDLARAVRERLKPDTLDVIETVSARALLSVDLDVELTECFFAEAGPDRARRGLRKNLRQSIERPFLLGTGFRLLGPSPARIVRWAPRIWELVYRDAGQLESALEDLDRAIELDAGLVNAYYNRTLTNILLGRDAEAQQDVDRAVALGYDPESLVAAINQYLELPVKP